MRRSFVFIVALTCVSAPACAQSSGMSAASASFHSHGVHQDRWLSKGLNGLFGNLAKVSDAARPVADLRVR